MKRKLRAGLLALALCFAAGAMTLPAMAQQAHVKALEPGHTKSLSEAQKFSPPSETMDAPETEEQHNEYLYSPSVQWFAKKIGWSVKTTALIFENLNSWILLIAIFYFLFRALPRTFRRRSEQLSKDLVEARQVSEDSKVRLAAIEERLSHLDSEIEAFRKRSEREAVEEQRRMHDALEEERKRIVHSAEVEIEAASAMAQRNLRRYAAELAVGQVRSNLKVGVDRDRVLVAEFAKSVGGNPKGGQS